MVTRRQLLFAAGAATAASAAGTGAWIMGGSMRFKTIDEARAAVASLAGQPMRTTGAWSLSQVLNHAAQSVEYSLDGFPQPKPAWFRATVGPLAFKVFDARGEMRHPLDAPIPGAPAIDAQAPLDAAVRRLLAAFDRFDRHSGPLQQHFAYGALDKPTYARAHLMHLAEHWTEFQAT
jgi:hypothetical protein